MVEMILSIIFGGGMIGLAVYNLIIWKLIKSDSSVIKAKLVARSYGGRNGNKSIWYCTMEYTINNKEYRRDIMVGKESPLYYRSYRERI